MYAQGYETSGMAADNDDDAAAELERLRHKNYVLNFETEDELRE